MEVTPPHSFKPSWLHYFPLVQLAVFVFLFVGSFTELYSRWTKWDEGLSHGLLVNAVFIYFIYTSLPWQAQSASKLRAISWHIGVALLSLVWLMFHIATIYVLENFTLIFLLAGLYICSYGFSEIKKYRLLLLLPLFTIPIWEHLNSILVNMSSFVVGHLVKMVQLPAIIDGNSIFIPYGHIVIADGCSGLRYFEIALALGYIISLLNHYDERRMLPTLLIAAALGLVANWIRIFALVIIGYQTEMKSSLMTDHEFFGWLLFAALCFPAIYFAPVVKAARDATKLTANNQKPLLLTPLLVVSLGPLLGLFISATPEPQPHPKRISSTVQASTLTRLPVEIFAPDKPQKEFAQIITPDGTVAIEVDHYQRLDAKDKLVPYINRLFESELWTANTESIRTNGHSAKLTRFRHKSLEKSVMQLQWFEVGDRITASLPTAKILQIPALLGGENHFAIVTLQVICDENSCAKEKLLLLNNHNKWLAPIKE